MAARWRAIRIIPSTTSWRRRRSPSLRAQRRSIPGRCEASNSTEFREAIASGLVLGPSRNDGGCFVAALLAMTTEDGSEVSEPDGKESQPSPRQTRRRPMPVRQGRLRDRRAGALGLARSFGFKPPRAWRGVRNLCRKLAQALPHHQGQDRLARYEDKATKTVRSFCSNCGTPISYERPRSPHMVNIPRALFSGRTGRQPLYHIAIEELQEWAYTGEPLVPLKGFPGVVWQRSKKKKRRSRGLSDPVRARREVRADADFRPHPSRPAAGQP